MRKTVHCSSCEGLRLEPFSGSGLGRSATAVQCNTGRGQKCLRMFGEYCVKEFVYKRRGPPPSGRTDGTALKSKHIDACEAPNHFRTVTYGPSVPVAKMIF